MKGSPPAKTAYNCTVMGVSGSQSQASLPEFSLIHGGPFYGVRKALGFVPGTGFRLARQTAILVAVLWLPVVIGAIAEHRLLPGEGSDPLFRHFGIHARLLVAIPLLIYAEVVMERIVPSVVRQFTLAGLVFGRTQDEFIEILHRAQKLRDSIWGKLLVGGVLLFSIVLAKFHPLLSDEVAWTGSSDVHTPQFGFAGWWFLYVGRLVFIGLLTLWAWRLLVGWRLILWISRLDLHLVPSHPDRAGGLGFVQHVSIADAFIVLAISVVLAGRWGHDVLYHSMHIDSLKLLVAAYVVMVLILFLGPLLFFSKSLRRFQREALLQYSALVGTQGRLVHRKWIKGEEIGDQPILDSPELSCVADTNTVFDAVEHMRVLPIGKEAVIPLILAAAVPMLPVFAIQVPLKELLLKIATSLI
ncbi:MAG TPA: hypothetical protein VEX68_30170 [Bryobacteraceae bacterium]|nr:hypothetical protein [Bryobacteraceae bacterium]